MEADKELDVMRRVMAALSELDERTAVRVVRWVMDRHTLRPSQGNGHTDVDALPENGVKTQLEGNDSPYKDLASFYDLARPVTDTDKALVVGYWFQEIEGEETIDAGRVNTALKNLGHGISNITRAFNLLKSQKPSLAIQVQKGGTTQQARKRFKITAEGIRKVKQMLSAAAAKTA